MKSTVPKSQDQMYPPRIGVGVWLGENHSSDTTSNCYASMEGGQAKNQPNDQGVGLLTGMRFANNQVVLV